MSTFDFGVLLPKKILGRKTSFPQRHFATSLQISPDWNKTPSTDRKTALHNAITPVHAYQIWWTLVHKWRIGTIFQPTQSQLFGRSMVL